ncbi:MAG: hypothetical protein HC783_13310 [Rhodobacteraceae bacterium]|nr:hypothetical protein [Paracoccaceae bacterium]
MGSDNYTMSKPGLAKWAVEPRPGGTFNVRAPDGSLYGTYGTLNQAASIVGIRQKEDDAAARRMTRSCMCCKALFESEGIHNRLCGRCRGLGEGGWNPHAVAPRSGRPR